MCVELVAFYGTLMTGMGYLPGHPEPGEMVGPCRLAGRLYDVGRYPALVPGPGVVVGELWRVDAAALVTLDAWEEYEPADEARSVFVRRRVELVDPPSTAAWTYVWNRPVAALALIPGGDWRAYRG